MNKLKIQIQDDGMIKIIRPGKKSVCYPPFEVVKILQKNGYEVKILDAGLCG